MDTGASAQVVALWNKADQEEAVSSKTLVSVLAAALAVTVPAASAHTLSKATARHEAAKVGTPLSKSVGGVAVYDCDRRSVHAFLCRISVVARGGDVCVAAVRVAYRRHDSRAVRHRTVSGPTCQPPELLGVD